MKRPRKRGPRVRKVNGCRFVIHHYPGGWSAWCRYMDRFGGGRWSAGCPAGYGKTARRRLLSALHDAFAPRRAHLGGRPDAQA